MLRFPPFLRLGYITMTMVAVMAPACAEVAPIDIRIVPPAIWHQDLQGAWWMTLAPAHPGEAPRPLPGPLVVPFGSPPIPVPNANGLLRYTDWVAFQASALNPQANAVRLLGAPSGFTMIGNEVVLTWAGPRLHGFPTAAGPTDASLTLTIRVPSIFTWVYHPLPRATTHETLPAREPAGSTHL